MAEFRKEESTVPIGGDTLKTGEAVNQSITENAAVAVDLRSVDQTRLMSCFHHPFRVAKECLWIHPAPQNSPT